MKILDHEVNNKTVIRIIVLVIIYVLLGNIPQINRNPIIANATLAVNMIVIVISGILFGSWVGFFVGLFGTFFNALSPAGNAFEFASIVPHAVMGGFAGYLGKRTQPYWASFAIIIGHLLNVATYVIAPGLLELVDIQKVHFWYGLGYETIFGIISISLIVYIYQSICKPG